MGAVFAMFSGWYYWIPKILGLNYNIVLAKIQFWVLFIGVRVKGRIFVTGKRFINQFSVACAPNQGSPLDPKEFILFFENMKQDKKLIYQELRKKSGVYVFINNITKELYVGSSINLTKRMVSYYYYYNSDKPTRSIILRAMKKYGLENFSLGIKEFCIQDPQICLKLEQKWIDYYGAALPKYNILTMAGNSCCAGYKHSVETINKLKEIFSKESHEPLATKFGSTANPSIPVPFPFPVPEEKEMEMVTDETKKAISVAGGSGIKNYYSNNSHIRKGLKAKLSPQYGIGGTFVFCYNKTGEELIFPSINATKQHFKVRWSYIKNNIDTNQSILIQGEEWLIQSQPKQK